MSHKATKEELEDSTGSDSDSELEEVREAAGKGWRAKEAERQSRKEWGSWNRGGGWQLGMVRIYAYLWPWDDTTRGFASMLAAGELVETSWEVAGWDVTSAADHLQWRRASVRDANGELLRTVQLGTCLSGEVRMVGRMMTSSAVVYGVASAQPAV